VSDNLDVTPGTGAKVSTEDLGSSVQIQRVKTAFGSHGSATNADSGNGTTGAGTQRVTISSDSTGQIKLASGTSLVGSFSIDQTTPGTTNLVSSAQSGVWNITNISGTVSLPTGAATSARQDALAGLIGEVQATPTANTLLGRLKDIQAGVAIGAGSNVIGKVGIDQTTDGATNLVVAKQSGTWNVTNISGTVSLPTGAATSAKQDTLAGLVGEVQASPTSNTVLDRLKALLTGIALSSGSNVIGKVSIDQTTDGTTNLVAAKQNGTWNITNVSGTVSLPTGAATAAKQAALGTAGSASADVITVQGIASGVPVTCAAAPTTGAVYNGTTVLTPLFATVVASASGATTIVSAVSSKKIRVLALSLIAGGTVNAKWQSHTTPTDLTGLAYLGANGGYVLPFSPVGWFETVSGEALDINLSASVAVGGSIVYVTV
jgi:hypothetical protein